MAQDHLIFHTNDRVVTSTSLGNQEKWFDAEKNLWYKVDNGHFEALAEAMASEVLRRFTNAADLPEISIAHYWVDTADVHGLPQVLSVSENFKANLLTSVNRLNKKIRKRLLPGAVKHPATLISRQHSLSAENHRNSSSEIINRHQKMAENAEIQ